MPKMEPIDTPASILDEPSRGSKTTQYFLLDSAVEEAVSETMMTFGTSSETMTLTRPEDVKQFTNISFAKTSNFLTVSPCTLTSCAPPAKPVRLARPARRTWLLMNLQAT